MDHKFQKSYVDDKKKFYNKYIYTRSEGLYLIMKRETIVKNCNTNERSFMYYETDTESHEISITSFSVTCSTEQDWDSLPYCRTLQLCKYSSCYVRPQSSLYTHSSSYGGRQCGDYRYCILWWIEFGALADNIIYFSTAHCGSLATSCHDFWNVWWFCVHLVYT